MTTRLPDTENPMNVAHSNIDNKIVPNTERVTRNEDKLQINKPMTERLGKDDDKDKKEAKGMRTLAMSVQNPNFLDFNGGEAVGKGPDVWVRKWVD